MFHLIPGQHIHFVGIGGYGLSAIARVLLEQGFYVSGSDTARNELTEALKRDGALIYLGHDPGNVSNAELVVYSSAVTAENIEVLAARAQGIPVYKRSEIIGAVMRGHRNIAIAGTHGKTTTTAMTTHIFIQARYHPSYIIGGILANSGQNAGIGAGKTFIIEADEYDNMFHGLHPHIEVITNIEFDHPDFFRSPRDLTASFRRFVGLLPNDGLLVACADDPTTEIFANNRLIVNLPTATYGILNPNAHWRATDIHMENGQMIFNVLQKGELRGAVTLPVPGHHNILNALAALVVADNEGIAFEEAANALATFKGTGRRFEVRADVDGVVVIDDYAHHPTAIRVTLATARQRYPQHDLWAVWQPHTYSRTQRLYEGFLASFANADHVLITDIFAARETPNEGLTSADLAQMMKHPDVRHTPSLEDAVNVLSQEVRPPAVILIMSAGDGPQIGIDYLARLQGEVG